MLCIEKLQKSLKEMAEELEEYINCLEDVRESINDKTVVVTDKTYAINIGGLKEVPLIMEEIERLFFQKTRNNSMLTEKEILDIIDRYSKSFSNVKKQVISTINSFSQENYKVDDFSSLLYQLTFIYEEREMNIQDLSQCLGLSVYQVGKEARMTRVLKEMIKKESFPKEPIEELSEFYKEDGTFAEKSDNDRYADLLLDVVNAYNSEAVLRLCHSFVKYQKTSYEKQRNKANKNYHPVFNIPQNSDKVLPIDLKTIKEAQKELRMYYRNHVLIDIPDNLSRFIELLNICGIPSEEQELVLSEIRSKRKKDKKKLRNISCFSTNYDSSSEFSIENESVADENNILTIILSALNKEEQELIALSKHFYDWGIANAVQKFYILDIFKDLLASAELKQEDIGPDDRLYIENSIRELIKTLTTICYQISPTMTDAVVSLDSSKRNRKRNN